MTLTDVNEILRERIRLTAKTAFDIELDQIASETPPKTELGDFAFPVAFELAKRIKQETGEKRNPRDIAAVVKASLEEFDFIQKVEVAGAGYLNVYLNRTSFFTDRAGMDPLPHSIRT